MDYVLTEHARDALARRNISLIWVERALHTPEMTEADSIDADLEHRLVRIPEFGNRMLRVVVNVKKVPPHVVTAFIDRRRSFRET